MRRTSSPPTDAKEVPGILSDPTQLEDVPELARREQSHDVGSLERAGIKTNRRVP